jgi:hypothetical protein
MTSLHGFLSDRGTTTFGVCEEFPDSPSTHVPARWQGWNCECLYQFCVTVNTKVSGCKGSWLITGGPTDAEYASPSCAIPLQQGLVPFANCRRKLKFLSSVFRGVRSAEYIGSRKIVIGAPTLTKVLMSVNATENCKARRIVIQQGSERASKVPAQRRVAFLNYPPLQKISSTTLRCTI